MEKILKNSLVKIFVDEKNRCTGWFFHPTKPYFISCGHFFVQNDIQLGETFSVELFDGKICKGKLISCEWEGVRDYSISILSPECNETYTPIELKFNSFNLSETRGKRFWFYGFGLELIENSMYNTFKGQIANSMESASDKVIIHELIEDTIRDKKGASGGPVFLISDKGQFPIGIGISQNPSTNESLACFSITNLFHLDEFQEVKEYYGSLKYRHPLQNSISYTKELNRYAGILPIRKQEELSRALKRKWSSFIESFQNRLLNHHGENFKNNGFFSDNLITYKTGQDGKVKNIDALEIGDVRVLIDFENKFEFGNPKKFENKMSAIPKGTHLIGIVFDNEEYISSNDFFDQIIRIRKDELSTNDLIDIIFKIVKDILLDIFYFNHDLKNLSERYPTIRSRKEFSKSKVYYALKNDFKPYGLDISKKINYISIPSLLKPKFNSTIVLKDFDLTWKDFTENFISNYPEFAPHLKSNRLYGKKKIIANSDSLYQEFLNKIPYQIWGQLRKDKLIEQLTYYKEMNESFFFCLVLSRPKKKANKDAIKQLFGGKGEFRMNMHNIFPSEKRKLFEPFRNHLLIVESYEIKET